MAGSETCKRAHLHLRSLAGFRRITPIVPRTSKAEAKPTHGRVSIQNFEGLVTRAKMIKLVVEGQITPQTSRSPSAAAMDDYSDIDVIL